jgi:hypothetical protein
MDPAILAAIITTAGSVIVALINKASKSSAKQRVAVVLPSTNKRIWWITMLILIAWLLISPVAIHWDLGGSNFLLLPVVTLVLAFVKPLRPLSVAAIVLFLYAFNFMMEPLGKVTQNMSTLGHWEAGFVATILAFAGVNALLAGLICLWRSRRLVQLSNLKHEKSTEDGIQPQSHRTIEELEKLTRLRDNGSINESEFQELKKRLLENE